MGPSVMCEVEEVDEYALVCGVDVSEERAYGWGRA